MKKKHELGVSRLVTSHFHLKIAERIGETDGIHNAFGKYLKRQQTNCMLLKLEEQAKTKA